MYILKSEHAMLLNMREDEVITDMRKQLAKGHVDMRRQTVEVVESSLFEHRAEITRLEEDKQHLVDALAESMNEVTMLRNKPQYHGEWDYDEEYEDGDQYLEHWYRAETGHPEAVGVGDLDYGEIVRKAVAPMTGPLTKPDPSP